MFEKLSRFTEKFAHHRHASYWLYFYALSESLIIPVPPDVLLTALTLGHPKRAQGFALIAGLGSITGGIIGYLLGRYAFDPVIAPILNWFCQYIEALCPETFIPQLEHLFHEHGFWIVAISAFSPIIPYRLMIVVAGIAHMPLVPFAITSFAVHWARYALVCGLVQRYGRKAVRIIRTQLPLAFILSGALALAVYFSVTYF